jgi:hypothetical protein
LGFRLDNRHFLGLFHRLLMALNGSTTSRSSAGISAVVVAVVAVVVSAVTCAPRGA